MVKHEVLETTKKILIDNVRGNIITPEQLLDALVSEYVSGIDTGMKIIREQLTLKLNAIKGP